MKILGALIAGGRASRFGSDKGAALLNDRPLIDHVAAGLRLQVAELVVVGRQWPGISHLADRPVPHLGPLGGLCAALHYGSERGYDAVLTAGCDTVPLPPDLFARLTPASAVVEGHWTIGLWDCAWAEHMDDWLSQAKDLSIRAWMRETGARIVPLDWRFHNINTPADLAALQKPSSF